MSLPAIRFLDLALGYGKHKVIKRLNIDIPHGALLAVVGSNGAGKSTLLKALMGQLDPMKGRIHLPDFNQRDIAYLPQRTSLEPNFPMNVRDFVAMGLWKQIGAFGFISSTQQSSIDQALVSVGLADLSGESLSSLSGGQMQRALFARLLLQDAPIILLDEPFNAIDEQTVQDLMVLVQQWHQQGRTVLAVLHDLQLVSHYFPDTLWLANGHGNIGETADVLAQHFQRWVA